MATVEIWTTDDLLVEAIAYGMGRKSVRNSYGGWSSEEQTIEARDASIATTDTMTALGYYVAAMAQRELERRPHEGSMG